MKTWIELREPGKVPERKGAFLATEQVKAFLIEVFEHRPSALVTVVTLHADGPSFEDGPEWLEILDRRQAHRAARHRRNTAQAWAQRH